MKVLTLSAEEVRKRTAEAVRTFLKDPTKENQEEHSAEFWRIIRAASNLPKSSEGYRISRRIVTAHRLTVVNTLPGWKRLETWRADALGALARFIEEGASSSLDYLGEVMEIKAHFIALAKKHKGDDYKSRFIQFTSEEADPRAYFFRRVKEDLKGWIIAGNDSRTIEGRLSALFDAVEVGAPSPLLSYLGELGDRLTRLNFRRGAGVMDRNAERLRLYCAYRAGQESTTEEEEEEIREHFTALGEKDLDALYIAQRARGIAEGRKTRGNLFEDVSESVKSGFLLRERTRTIFERESLFLSETMKGAPRALAVILSDLRERLEPLPDAKTAEAADDWARSFYAYCSNNRDLFASIKRR